MGGEELEPSPQLLGVITSVFLLRYALCIYLPCENNKCDKVLSKILKYQKSNISLQPLAVPLHRGAGKMAGNWTILVKI